MINFYRATRRGTIFKAIMGREPFYWVKVPPGVIEIGSKYGRWAIDSTNLSEATTLVSFGLGDDVSFEMGLIEKFGCQVLGFDPTPRSIEYISRMAANPKFKSHPYAISDKDGTLKFILPPDNVADQTSASAIACYTSSLKKVDVPCMTLATAQAQFNIPRIDVLKLDIEGTEYCVIEHAIANGWIQQISQLLVEFHHFLPGLLPEQTRNAVARLRGVGFKIAWVGRTNHEYLFIR